MSVIPRVSVAHLPCHLETSLALCYKGITVLMTRRESSWWEHCSEVLCSLRGGNLISWATVKCSKTFQLDGTVYIGAVTCVKKHKPSSALWEALSQDSSITRKACRALLSWCSHLLHQPHALRFFKRISDTHIQSTRSQVMNSVL
jgi:hypothetical protein